MFFNAPVSMSLYSRDYYPRYCLGTLCPVPVLASERAWALRYQQQPVNQPNPTALLVHEYDEFPDQQRMMRVLRSCKPQDEKNIDYVMSLELAEMQRADLEEEQVFARHRADAEKFLEEAETYLSEFLPPDEEPSLGAFQLFDQPDTPVPTSTSKVFVQDGPLLKFVIEDCAVTENRPMAEYRFEVRDTLQSILDCLSAATSTEGPIEHVPVPSTTAETYVDEGGATSSQEGKGEAKEIPGFDAEEPSASSTQVPSSFS
ncbi:hypothetical protein BD769DRAFT_1659313 [Suillus cothurnatus]|nr:hypothetical protein BD769DRAFT_1659313 [Suillus cothurnatus]